MATGRQQRSFQTRHFERWRHILPQHQRKQQQLANEIEMVAQIELPDVHLKHGGQHRNWQHEGAEKDIRQHGNRQAGLLDGRARREPDKKRQERKNQRAQVVVVTVKESAVDNDDQANLPDTSPTL